MDFDFSPDQRAIVDAVEVLCTRLAGPKRAIALDVEGGYDGPLHRALDEAGFSAVLRDVGLLEAVLVAEVLSRHAAVTSFAAHGIVLPGLGGPTVSGAVALVVGDREAPARYAAHAEHVLRLDAGEARLGSVSGDERAAVPSNFMFPLGVIEAAALERTTAIGDGARARDLWRLAIAAECVGTMDSALDLTVGYVRDRRQFGRAIGSFQAVQHRLALCKVALEGARHLTYEAASKGGDAERVACAASHATQAAKLIHAETHQLTGALGFTREHDLFVWSMRLQALRVELDGVSGHRRALAAARWGLSP